MDEYLCVKGSKGFRLTIDHAGNWLLESQLVSTSCKIFNWLTTPGPMLFHRYGFVIAVTTIDSIGSGLILPGRGFVNYPIKYKAIVFRPIKGEVLEAIVTQVNKVSFWGRRQEAYPGEKNMSNPHNGACKSPHQVTLTCKKVSSRREDIFIICLSSCQCLCVGNGDCKLTQMYITWTTVVFYCR